MIPYLKDGNWDAGMVAGVKAVCSRLDGTMVNDTEEEDDLSVGGIPVSYTHLPAPVISPSLHVANCNPML